MYFMRKNVSLQGQVHFVPNNIAWLNEVHNERDVTTLTVNAMYVILTSDTF